MLYDRYYRVWADVNLDAIRSNIMQIQQGLYLSHPDVMTCAVIKADAYGHGAAQTAEAVMDLVQFFAVATMDEAMDLRTHGITRPILILGYVSPDLAAEAARQDIRLTVYDLEQAKAISRTLSTNASLCCRIHIKVDTGMGRIGFFPSERSAQAIQSISCLPGLETEGLFTHFANADDETTEDAEQQLMRFDRFVQDLKTKGLSIPVIHCSNSAAATRLRKADHDMVRLGISMYGLYPSDYVHDIVLQPALSLKSRVVMVKSVPAGFRVGYGSTWTAMRDSVIATVPVGYADGYYRSLSNKGYVLIEGAQYPIVGRVCMDQFMVDVTEPIKRSSVTGKVELGSEVVLIGSSGDLAITMEEISTLAGSFNYEMACGLSMRVPRIYYRNGIRTKARGLSGIDSII